MTLRSVRWGLVALALASCAAPVDSAPGSPIAQATPLPTALPSATPTPADTATPSPLTEATPPIILEPPVHAPSPTVTPPAVGLPLERLAIFSPGPGSQVRSPFQVVGRGGPSWNERVMIRLFGEDGRLLIERTTFLFAYPGNAGRFSAEISFQTPLVAELGRLEVSTFDRRTGRMDHLTTLEITLLSVGAPRIHSALHGSERLTILSPREGAVIEGGRVTVRGAGWTSANTPLTVQLIDRNGEVLAETPVQLNSPEVGQLGTFEVELAYQVAWSQFARIAVFEPSLDLPGFVHYSSLEVYLRP
jgi:hypothetical protein